MSAARPSTRPPHGIRVAVAWASPRAQGVVEVDLPPGATVADAVAAVRALERAGVAPTARTISQRAEAAGSGDVSLARAGATLIEDLPPP